MSIKDKIKNIPSGIRTFVICAGIIFLLITTFYLGYQEGATISCDNGGHTLFKANKNPLDLHCLSDYQIEQILEEQKANRVIPKL